MISQMDDNHLTNTIQMLLKHIKEANAMITSTSIMVANIDFLIAGIDQEEVKRKAKEILIKAHDRIGRYMIEASIRGMDFSKDFQDAFGRKAKMVDVGIFKSKTTSKYLSEGFSLDDDGDDFGM